jgi:hypothetical protein
LESLKFEVTTFQFQSLEHMYMYIHTYMYTHIHMNVWYRHL